MTIRDSSVLMMENGGSCLPCTPDEERQIVQDLKNQSELDLKEGNLYFLISTRYFISLLLPRYSNKICIYISMKISAFIF